jgi:deoxycytidylate deaminase
MAVTMLGEPKYNKAVQQHRATEHRFVQSRRLHATIREVHAAVVLLLRAQEKGRQ